MPSNAMCCGVLITLREDGIGFDHDFDCRAFFSDQDPAWAAMRRSVCQQLFDADRLCPEIAPFCEQFKEDMQHERSRKRDEAERSASGQWPPASRAEDEVWDSIHTALDLAGLIPGIGIIPDALNAGIYTIEGDFLNAGISIVGMVEGIGQGATATRAAVKISRKAAKELGKDGLAKAFRDAKARSASSAGDLTGALHEGFPVRRYPPGPPAPPDLIRVREPDLPTDLDAVGTSPDPRVVTSTTHADVLAKNLELRSGPRPPDHEAHHIVATADKRADRAREILVAADIDMDSAANGIWLPKTMLKRTTADAASAHKPIHTDKYFKNVTRRLEAAAERGPEAVADALVEIYEILMENPNALSQ